MKLTSHFTVFLALTVGSLADRHVKKSQHRELLHRKRHLSRRDITGLLHVTDPACGWNGATHEVTATSGPNGAIDWLNCGIHNANGWTPPYVAITDIITTDLSEALKDPNSPFQPCSSFIWAFEQAGQQYNIPPIMIASFALQESSCNPGAVGGAGEQGLMQLTPDKCGNAPNGDCKEIGFNIKTGAKFFRDLLDQHNGNVLGAIGNYNGWFKGMTIGQATADGNGYKCRWQNNLDYLFQYLNGWVLNINAYTYTPRLGKYFNLDKCGK